MTNLNTANLSAEAPLWKSVRAKRMSADEILRLAEVVEPPVPVEMLIAAMDVEIRETDEPRLAGAVKFDEQRAVIWVKRGAPETRRRFTLAHELGHLLLHEEKCAHFRDETFNGGRKEYEANSFAANLLMPMWMLDPLIGQLSPRQLANIFEVSGAAMEIRLKEALGL